MFLLLCFFCFVVRWEKNFLIWFLVSYFFFVKSWLLLLFFVFCIFEVICIGLVLFFVFFLILNFVVRYFFILLENFVVLCWGFCSVYLSGSLYLDFVFVFVVVVFLLVLVDFFIWLIVENFWVYFFLSLLKVDFIFGFFGLWFLIFKWVLRLLNFLKVIWYLVLG